MSAPINPGEYKARIVRINGKWCLFANRWTSRVTRREAHGVRGTLYLPEYALPPGQHALHVRADNIRTLTARYRR